MCPSSGKIGFTKTPVFYFLNDQQAIDAVDGLYERFHQEAMYGRELF